MEFKEKRIFYPLLIDISNYKCLVIGGGSVALRKVKNLLEFDADITIISPELCFELENLVMAKKLTYFRRMYSPGDALPYNLVFVATNSPELAPHVKSDCDMTGALLNIAENPELSSIIIPATIKDRSFTISIASSGDAPYLTKKVREIIQKNLPANIGDISYLAGEYRQKVLQDARFDTQEKKDIMYDKFMFQDWQSIIDKYGFEGAFLKMAELLK
jgi:siroheme synthase-like protein